MSAGQPCPLVGGADAIVLVRPSDREPWRAVRRAHAASGAPVFVEPADGDEPGPPEVSLGGLSPVAASALVVAAARESARAVAAGRAGEDLRPYVRRDGAPTMDPSLRGGAMRAAVGDRIVIKGHRVGEPERDCEVLEVHGEDGGPPYLVRWGDNGHEALFFPGTDASVQHYVPDPG